MPRSTNPAERPSATRKSKPARGNLRSKNRQQNRALDAFAIASAEHHEKPAVPAHRLGDDQDDEEEEYSGDSGDGEDSSGNEWRVGQVDSDDDSDIDSDDAMGESDEERFADFSFRGSSTTGAKKKAGKTGKRKEIDLDEEESGSSADDESEEDGEGFIDLSEMLDRKTPESGDEEEKPEQPSKKRAAPESDEEGDEEGEESDSEESASESEDSFAGFDDEDADDDVDTTQLQSLISSLPTIDRPAKRVRLADPNEAKPPNEYNLAPSESQKLALEDLLPTVTNPDIKKSLKLLAGTDKHKTTGVPGKLAVPLAKRQQDRIDRAAAYEQTKETLKRWTATIKHNREADHLHFPLANASNASLSAPKKLQNITATNSTPLTALEATVAGILQESHMASEKQLAQFEALKTNKLSVEEVQRRTLELRKARELLYREEAKAKRIKKIKSKSYHRIKKKERLRADRAINEAITEGRGGEPDPEDEMEQERRRAEERMSLRHKQSRWAKGANKRAAWDEDARDGAVEMARRSDELRRRIEGKRIGGSGSGSDGEGEDDSESGSGSEDEFDEEGEGERAAMLAEIEKLEAADAAPTGSAARLMSMKFMQQAEAAKKKENDAALKSLREDWAATQKGDGSDDGSDDNDNDDEKEGKTPATATTSGRMVFKPGKNALKLPAKPQQTKRQELEAPQNTSDNEEERDEEEVTFINNASVTGPKVNPFAPPSKAKTPNKSPLSSTPISISTSTATSAAAAANPWLAAAASGPARKSKSSNLAVGKQEARGAKTNHKLSKARTAALSPTTNPVDEVAIDTTTITLKPTVSQADDGDAGDRDDVGGPVALVPARSGDDAKNPEAARQRELVKRAFAGDDVVREFAVEKRRAVDEQADKVVDDFLPGWVCISFPLSSLVPVPISLSLFLSIRSILYPSCVLWGARVGIGGIGGGDSG